MDRLSATGIAVFLILALAVSYGLSFGSQWLVAIQLLPLGEVAAETLANVMAVSGPFIAAAIVTWVRRRPVREWLRGELCHPRASAWWLIIPAYTTLVTFTAFLISGETISEIPAAFGGLSRLAGLFAYHVLVVGLLEELGWRGWLLRRLLHDRSPLVSTLVVAPIWYGWHLPKLLSDLEFAAAFAAATMANSIILTALWKRFNGKTILAAIAHGSFNAPLYFFAEHIPYADALQIFWLVAAANGLVALTLLRWDWCWWRGRTRALAARA